LRQTIDHPRRADGVPANRIFERSVTRCGWSGLCSARAVSRLYNETDDINGSRLNFAEQLGWRFPRQENGGHMEFAIRHVSNAGLRKPNKGEDFLTMAYVF
jgi:Lipid A 3-O-deacylase (PagL)